MRIQSIITAVATLVCLPAFGQTLFRYVDSSGSVHYSDKPLTEAAGRSVERISKTGTHLADKAVTTPTKLGAAVPPEPRHTDQDSAAKLEERRNLALLATYSSLKEIDDAQVFALRDPKRELRDAQTRMVDTGRRREQLQAQVDAYGSKPAPSEILEKLNTAELEFKSLAALVEAKRRDVQAINERYEEDRRRYAQLVPPNGQTGTKGVQPAGAGTPKH